MSDNLKRVMNWFGVLTLPAVFLLGWVPLVWTAAGMMVGQAVWIWFRWDEAIQLTLEEVLHTLAPLPARIASGMLTVAGCIMLDNYLLTAIMLVSICTIEVLYIRAEEIAS